MSLKREFLGRVPRTFKDPVTGLVAGNETELSALLSYYQARGVINWEEVGLYRCSDRERVKPASEYISASSLLFCEYPLFSNSETVDIWGQMPADLLLFSERRNSIALLENKIGSKFTSGGTQLARQAEYLHRSNFVNKSLIVLTSKSFLDRGWYLKEMTEVDISYPFLNVYCMYWEDIFSAIDVQS
ncbi:hypothetical protein QX226_21935 [Vibrio vulnificus]|uniref:hypothetical protein n=1 Tax=Vibrio vulnificus TaxID=672 RepID=UPI00287A4DD3|nr:hypothetical protein [Vibrio vulnificus]MDS1773990.1 hypothetical protein [Vibrio vulnificus]MDS1855257.1 hypothetical protein [Vibrio vulnificus]